MSRTSIIATGFLCIMLGVQLYLVESFTLTPRMSHFLTDNFSDSSEAPVFTNTGNATATPQFTQPRQAYDSSYYQASFGQNGMPSVATTVGARGNSETTLRPPRWIIWPVMFLGAFLILQGASRPK